MAVTREAAGDEGRNVVPTPTSVVSSCGGEQGDTGKPLGSSRSCLPAVQVASRTTPHPVKKGGWSGGELPRCRWYRGALTFSDIT